MKKWIALLLVLAMTLSFTACRQPENTASATAAASGYYPITVTDQAGREVTLEQEPQRIITAYYITSSLLMALDLDERIVGIENDPQKRAIYGLSAPELLTLPQIGTAKELDLEGVMALEPDLLILPMKLKNSLPTLEELGLTVLMVDPEDQQRLNGMIRLVGQAANRNDLAESLLNWIAEQQEFLKENLSVTSMPTVYLAGNSSMLKTAGDAMYQADMIRLAGGSNVAAAVPDTYWAEIDYEQLLAWDPEYIILARTMVSGSKLLLLDEPESALDFRHRYQSLSLLRSWVQQTGSSAIVTLHDGGLALNYCESLLLLSQGRVLGMLHPRTDTLETMEQMLSRVYGPVSLQYVTAKNGSRQLTMINEDTL